MRINHPVRIVMAGAVIASGSFLFAMSASASTSASPANVTQFKLKLEQQLNYPGRASSGYFPLT